MNNEPKSDRDIIKQLVTEALKEHTGLQEVKSEDSPRLRDESLKSVITEDDLKSLSHGEKILIREDAIITPLARDIIKKLEIEVRYKTRRDVSGTNRLIAVGSDHGGFEMKEELKNFLSELGYKYRDFGTYNEDAVDYPDMAHAVARSVADGVCDLGIIVDGAGIGSCMTANKVPGILAAMCYDEATARNSREHNYANVLTLGGRMIDKEKMRVIVKTWLSTPEGEARHGRRVAKITAIEKQYLNH